MSRLRLWAAWAATAALLHAFMQGLWPAGFVALVPWLLARHARPGWRAACLDGWALSVLLCAAGYAWMGLALGRYTGLGAAPGVLLLLGVAPLFQAQCWVYALARQMPKVGAAAGVCAWLAVEWAVPKVLGDTLGHALYPAAWLRQTAEWGGVAGLTLLLLISNEAVAAAWHQRSARLLGLPLLLGGLMAGAGYQRWTAAPPDSVPLRAGLVQALQDAEALRRDHGSAAALRQVLDLHFAMSFDAVERQGAQLLLWSETVYPTPFRQPKSEAGAAFDAELQATIRAGGVPLVFGTFQRDAMGEYNAVVLLDPQQGVVGAYRKTRLFPFTEWLPGPLEILRPALPGAGTWQPGDGARVLPVRAGGHEFVIAPLICLDASDAQLVRDAARLGAQLLINLSNDRWFGDAGPGARLHLAAAAFRSVETRLPQFRVTHTGISAALDARGEPLAQGALGERSLVVADLPIPAQPVLTLATRWGPWVGATAAAVWALLLAAAVVQRFSPVAAGAGALAPASLHPARDVTLPLPRPLRWGVGALRGVSRGVLLGLGAALLLDDNLRMQSWTTVRWLLAGVVMPEAVAFCLLRAAGLSGGEALAALSGWGLDPAARRAGPPAAGWGHPLGKFGLLPLLLALGAFHLHQHIAYGSFWGEALSFGWPAWFRALGLWWGGWLLAVLLLAALGRAVVELTCWALGAWQPLQARRWRPLLERLGLSLLYLGLPLWLGWRTL